MLDRICRYWQYGRWFQALSDLTHSLLPHPDPDWIAPFVFEKAGAQLIPIWIPLKGGLPFIPTALFDPLNQDAFSLFTEPLPIFDQWLRFEMPDRSVSGNVHALAREVLDHLSEGKWEQTLIANGFQQVSTDLGVSFAQFCASEPPIGSDQLNPLQQQYAQFSEDDSILPPDFDEDEAVLEDDSPEAPQSQGMSPWKVIPFTRGDPEKKRVIERLRVTTLSENRSLCLLRWDPHTQSTSFLQAHTGETRWRVCDALPPCDVVIIADAEYYFPHQIFPYLAFAHSAIFIGDPYAITPFPVITGYQDEGLLALTLLSDDGIQEEIHYRGMGIATGNALKVAMTHSLYGTHAPTRSHLPKRIAFVDQPGQSLQSGANPAQAADLAQWLEEAISTGEIDQQEVIIVTLFKAQQRCLQAALSTIGLSNRVYTVTTLPTRRMPHVVFSTVYTMEDPRPFLLDTGEALWHQLESAAAEVLWIVGDADIFDPKCHSPTGKIAKQWKAPVCV